MIEACRTEILQKTFPDGSLLIKPPSGWKVTRISWLFENNAELWTLIALARHYQNQGSEVELYMPYCPNSRQDRVKNDYDVFTLSPHTQTNIPPRIRMAVIYAIAQEVGYRVSGTGNASEAHVGYCTKWGDAACDFNPIASFTTDEVIAIGDYLGIPEHLTHKTPSDGLCGKSDEDNLGFTYETLNRYINDGTTGSVETDAKIAAMNIYSRHKFDPIPKPKNFTKIF